MRHMMREWGGRRSATSTNDNDALFRKVTRLCDVLNAEPGLQVLAVVGARWNVSVMKSRSLEGEIPFAPKTPAPLKRVEPITHLAPETRLEPQVRLAPGTRLGGETSVEPGTRFDEKGPLDRPIDPQTARHRLHPTTSARYEDPAASLGLFPSEE
jgi:hypothetical protein